MFGIDLFDAALMPSILAAILAGLLSFLSPCVLPIVPPYLAYMGGVSMSDMKSDRSSHRRAVIAALFFVLGLSTVFILLGIAATAFGRVFLQYQDIMAKAAGIVIIVFGLHFFGLLRIPFLMREARIDAGDQGGSAFGAYVLGLAFAFGWTPCIGPILGTILTFVAQDASFSRGIILMGAYALGLGVPFVLAAVFISRAMNFMNSFKRHMAIMEKAMGALLVIVGVMLLFGLFSTVSFWMLETFPILATFG
jgi:cytochrome c-type biogenesis protein